MGRSLSFFLTALRAATPLVFAVAPVLAQAPAPNAAPELIAPKLAAKPAKKSPPKIAAKPAASDTQPNPAAKPAAAPGGPSLLPGAASHEPINIAADKLDYFDKEQKLIYSGNVVAVQGESRLNATVLTILLDKKGSAAPAAAGPGGGSQVRRMEGKGPIAITSKDQIGTGDALVYDKPENKFYLIGNVALSQCENVTRGDKLIYDLTTGQAVVSSGGTSPGGRVHSLIIPSDQGAKPATPAPKPVH
jgi:lipopolysaccharide export system protein LptA